MNYELIDGIIEESDNNLEAMFASLLFAIIEFIFRIMGVALGEVEEVTD